MRKKICLHKYKELANGDEYKLCEQTKCGFMITGQGCRECEECKTGPYLVHDDCVRCWNCEHDAGILRWDDHSGKIEEKQLQVAAMK